MAREHPNMTEKLKSRKVVIIFARNCPGVNVLKVAWSVLADRLFYNLDHKFTMVSVWTQLLCLVGQFVFFRSRFRVLFIWSFSNVLRLLGTGAKWCTIWTKPAILGLLRICCPTSVDFTTSLQQRANRLNCSHLSLVKLLGLLILRFRAFRLSKAFRHRVLLATLVVVMLLIVEMSP